MKKIIQGLIIIILLLIICLVVVFVFNPFDLRTKIVSQAVNSYLEKTITDYEPLDSGSSTVINADHPLLSDSQEETLASFGVDTNKLPTEITPAMQDCAIEKLGEVRAKELADGATPGPMDILKARECLGK